jgi:hypothetical protein
MSGSVSASGCKSPGRLGFIILKVWLLISVITTGRGLTSGWTSNARFPGRSPLPAKLFKSPNLEAYTIAMNVSQREGWARTE